MNADEYENIFPCTLSTRTEKGGRGKIGIWIEGAPSPSEDALQGGERKGEARTPTASPSLRHAARVCVCVFFAVLSRASKIQKAENSTKTLASQAKVPRENTRRTVKKN